MRKSGLFVFLLCAGFHLLGQIKQSKEVDAVFSEWNKPNEPGGAIGVVLDGKLIYTKGYGIADLEHDVKITPSSVFYIGSVSKQFVTFSILLLEEEGKLNLDDNIQKYFPDFPDYGSPPTIRHFIHHTSGVRDYLTLMYLKGRDYLDEISVDEVYELIKRQSALNFTPGEQYLYSNSCYFMLALIVEQVAGESIRDYAKKNIFEPLGMKHSQFYDDNTDLIKNRVFSYEKNEEKEMGFNNLINRFELVGSGGVYSTIEDLYLWDQNFYDNRLGKGGQTIITKMHQEGILNNGKSSGYAFAVSNGDYKGLKTVSHSGALAGYRSQLLRFPKQKFSVIILANRADANPSGMSYTVADIFLQDEFIIPKSDKKKIEESSIARGPSTFTMQQVVGKYEVQPGVIIEIDIQEDSLHLIQHWNNASYRIVHTGQNTYEIKGSIVAQFVFSELEKDATQVLTIHQNGNEEKWKRKTEIDNATIIFSDFLGEYYSAELDATYYIYEEAGILKVKIPAAIAANLKANATDEFIADGIVFRFSRHNGTLAGFEVDAGRVKNLKFVKK